MIKTKSSISFILSAIMLISCKSESEKRIECGAATTKELVISAFDKKLDKYLFYTSRNAQYIRSQITPSVDFVRTIKTDFDTHRNECQAVFFVSLPEKVKGSIRNFNIFAREGSKIEYSDSNGLSVNIYYTSQSTDDLENQYVEVNGLDTIIQGIYVLAIQGYFGK